MMARRILLILILLWLPGIVQAALEIRVTQGVEGATPVAVVPFAWSGEAKPPQDLAAIVAADLGRSGRFAPVAREDLPARPHALDQVEMERWRGGVSDYLVVGRLDRLEDGRFRVRFQLIDAVSGREMEGYRLTVPVERLRRAAHRISDIVYERLTGERGAFDTRVAYVRVIRDGEDTRYALQVADADGHNPRTVFRSRRPILSPSWAPDGQRLAYVSFENRRSEVYIQDLSSGERTLLASYAGINGAPAWSPDGQRLALTLSREGDPDIHVYDLRDGSLRRVTRDRAIDTEPQWMPDGRSLVFTSDRAGQPQLYRVDLRGGRPQRLSFQGRYNGDAAVAPDGDRIAMVHGEDGGFRIALLDLRGGSLRPLTDGPMDESPSFAPNGSMLIYATAQDGRGVLAAVSADGRVHQRLVVQEGEVREPAWSPFLD
ncbi:TolB protein [Ectothiorhodospira mobilis]|uniref:Tol-Pal system protein TolB n=1 Tax=Ectothiorhodospira mobilis TaxID=195064 RepID=A0A1I4RDC3_ECTMO|nr:Tol-Pal system beta propeller repeat protein TolB [Ectothiorhodospira mobilis]SFM50274.1 TolB protein [Ectothiorhodospira mobilis]